MAHKNGAPADAARAADHPQESQSARRGAHNAKKVGSTPTPATNASASAQGVLTPKAKTGPEPVARRKVDAANAVEPILERIAEGQSFRKICKDVGVSLATLAQWLDDNPERIQAHARARQLAADAFDELAEQRIDEASDPFELAKARELATHYRWRAKAANPKRYGDKTTVQGDPDQPIQHSLAVRFVSAQQDA